MTIPGSASSMLMAAAAAAPPAGYQIERSLRFNSSDSAYASKTFSSPTTQGTFTFAAWIKRAALGTTQHLFGVSTNHSFGFTSGDALNLTFAGSSALTTTALFRDPSAWYHIVWTQSGTSHTLYVNNVSVGTATATSSVFNTAVAHQIGAANTANYFNGYLADIHFIDGQALTPSSFTEVSATTGQLVPIAYTGSYGTNGFRLKFADNSNNTATTLGADTSGNGNNWTPNNLSVTAGSGNDSLVDTPTSYGTDTGAGGEVRGNYATWNPLPTTTAKTFSDGNLQVVGSGADGFSRLYGTFGMARGKWYFEVVPTAISGYVFIGISASEGNGYSTNAYYYASNNGTKSNRGGGSFNVAYGSTFTSNDVIGVAVDMDTGKIWFAKNGVWQASGNPAAGTNAAYTDVLTYLKEAYVPYVTTDEFNSYTVVLNAGQRPFAYTAPSGFKALCDTNLPSPVVAKPNEVMDVKLYTGNGSTQTISGLGFSPDLVWIKNRAAADNHKLLDTVRGATNELESNTTDAEVANADGLTAFNSDGFDLGADVEYNTSSEAYVAWAWDAGSSTVTNTDGSITSSVRANPSAGFSIVTISSATGSAGATIGHGLNVTPALIIQKARTTTYSWNTYFNNNGTWIYLVLNDTSASSATTTANMGTTPTSTTMGLGSNFSGSHDYVYYCFAPVAGYSSFGSYTGNGSADGPFVYTGFRPKFLLVKNTAAANNWCIIDSARNTYNIIGQRLFPNLSNAEDTQEAIDFLSNGFKVRNAGSSVFNNSGQVYIYAAFAEHPFATARAR